MDRVQRVKDLLLQEAKITESTDIEKLAKMNPLSLEYDRISVIKPYTTRVSGALLALLFFEKLDKGETNFMSENVRPSEPTTSIVSESFINKYASF